MGQREKFKEIRNDFELNEYGTIPITTPNLCDTAKKE